MKRWFAALSGGLFALVVATILWRYHVPETDRTGSYYVTALFLAAVMFSGFAIIQLVYHRRGSDQQGPRRPVGPDPANQREAYRVSYPPGSGPALDIHQPKQDPAGGRRFQVLDLSEHGLSLANPHELPFKDAVLGRLTFPDGQQAEFSAKVIWRRDGRVSLKLITPLAPEIVVAEQRRMIADQRTDG